MERSIGFFSHFVKNPAEKPDEFSLTTREIVLYFMGNLALQIQQHYEFKKGGLR